PVPPAIRTASERTLNNRARIAHDGNAYAVGPSISRSACSGSRAIRSPPQSRAFSGVSRDSARPRRSGVTRSSARPALQSLQTASWRARIVVGCGLHDEARVLHEPPLAPAAGAERDGGPEWGM